METKRESSRVVLGTREYERLQEAPTGWVSQWRRWGPFVSDRAWGTVREDYSPGGTAWDFLTHDLARSKAYRWGEDGIAGICDRYEILVFALALWNGRDPILKERLFGLNSQEGNHGEDVKEYYFYLDNTPTHSYMKMLYKYPQAEFPYNLLVEENRRRAGRGLEFELIDTGVFEDNRYFDVFVEYAKASPEDICIRIEAWNRGPEESELHLLPHLWFRNTWAWTDPPAPEPGIAPGPGGDGYLSLQADDSSAKAPPNLEFQYHLGARYLYAPAEGKRLFTSNETNGPRVFGASAASRKPFVKDAFHRHLVNGEPAVNPEETGTKACIHYRQRVAPGDRMVLRLRLTPERLADPLADVDAVLALRKQEADEFYAALHPPASGTEERAIQRQALAGLLWSKQIYLFDVEKWLEGDNPHWPPPEGRKRGRNIHWRHLNSMRVLSMPDKWEYPWFAAWDLAFQSITMALVDPLFAKNNLWYLLFEQFQHPNGQIPAYEWEFSDLNPPVHAWACWRVYQTEKERTGKADLEFLEKCFHKLLINFAWWVNKVDSQGNNVFEGGFLGLDNITVVDRSERLPSGVILEQSDGTGWMGFSCLYLMRIALELARGNKTYEGLATKFFEHYIYIGAAMKRVSGQNYQLWDERDGFFYDVLRYPNGEFHKFRVRSLVGLIPMFAVEVLRDEELKEFPRFLSSVDWFIRNRPELVGNACYTEMRNGSPQHVLSIVDRHQLSRILARLWDPGEFLSEAGIRSLSRYHREHPFTFGSSQVRYEPAEEEMKLKGGNSNWRGPIWFPINYLIVESLVKFSEAFGEDFAITTPSGAVVTPRRMAAELADRLIALFKRSETGRRPVYGGTEKFQSDPHWRDYLLFYEHFHGDNGAGLGASHQTGWTSLVANLIDERGR
jgi:Mannosylglycerate hydrolase MGH1-like glycoside hydrolase domain/Glycosyl hydrolase family 63 C-terminal domain